MTWEIALGIFALIAALVPVFNIVVRVNKTLCSLEVVVKQIKECIEDQSAKNGIFFTRLSEHDIRLTKIEDKLEIVVKQIKECIEDQSAKNGIFFTRLSQHEVRLTKIEDKLDIVPKATWEEAWRLYFKKNFGKKEEENEKS